MDKLTAAQRRFGMQLVVQAPTDREMNPGPATPFIDFGFKGQHDLSKSGPEFSQIEKRVAAFTVPTGDRFPLLVGEIAHKESVIVELQRLLNEKDAEIDRLLEPTKWWRMLGWVIMTGTVLGVIAGVYEVIT